MSVYVAFIYDNEQEKYIDYTQAFKDIEACERVARKLCEQWQKDEETSDETRFQYDVRELEVYESE